MKFHDVRIENFLTIKESTVALADRGLVLVQGVNEIDTSGLSNGAGKSTVFDAIAWCLFGSTARGTTGDGVINNQAKKNCLVDLELRDGAEIYKVIRHRKHAKHKNALHVFHYDTAGVSTDLTKGTDKLTQEVVQQIIGASYDVFCGAVYAGQEKMPDLPGMTDKNLKVLVEEAAGTTILEKGYKIALQSIVAAKDKVATASASVDLVQVMIDSIDKVVVNVTNDGERFEEKREDAIDNTIHTVKETINKAGVLKRKIDAADLPALEAKLKIARDKLDAVAGERSTEQALYKKTAAESSNVTIITRDLDTLRRRGDAEKKTLDDVDHKIGCPCGECARPLTAAEIAPAKKAAADRLRATVDEYKTRKSDLESAQKSLQSVTDSLEAHRASMTDVSATNAEIATLNDKIAGVRDDQRDFNTLVATAKDLKDSIERIKKQENPHKATLDRLLSDRDAAAKKQAEAGEQLAKYQEDLEIAESVAKVFAPAGARAEMLDEVTPYLNSQTAKYLGTLSDGNMHATWTTLVKTAKGDMKEKFAIEVVHDLGGDDFTNISGGEKRKVRIACALALQDLVASRATKAIDLFVGDEIDDALDNAGLERLVMILEEKALERGSVFIISHSDLKDWVRSVITVTKKSKGHSIIEDAA